MFYDGIKLDIPADKPVMSHSVSFDMIRGESSTQNMDWMDSLGAIPWGKFKDACPERFAQASKIFSLANMDYQVCNGGIAQYFFNRYNKGHAPFHEHDVAHFDVEVQKECFSEVVVFAKTIFPERDEENRALVTACNAFDKLIFEENAQMSETIYCDEDEYIYDEELGEDVPNPNYFEPYEEFYEEDYIHNGEGFDDIFYRANDYLEELLEIQAQLCCKKLVLEVEKETAKNSELLDTLKEHLPQSAFVKSSLSEKIQSASARQSLNRADGKPGFETPHR